MYFCIIMRNLVLTLALLAGLSVGFAAESGGESSTKMYAVGFYNVENLFDTCHDAGKKDLEFTPKGQNQWTAERYASKLHNLSRVLSEMGTDVVPEGCAVIGLAEVENAKVLDDLVAEPLMRERGFKYCHIEGVDERGIDCALLYNPRLFEVRNVKLVPFHCVDSVFLTRGSFIVSGTMAGEHVSVIVNHLPSRFNRSKYREQGGAQIRQVKDSLLRDDPQVKVFVMGDMNDDPQDASMAEALGAKRYVVDVTAEDMYNPFWQVLKGDGLGTLSYRRSWNLFDQIILSPSLLRKDIADDMSTLHYMFCQIFTRRYLFRTGDDHFAGTPLRTFGGRRWLNGYSDHLPTVVYLMKENLK